MTAEDSFVNVVVADNGIGMTEEVQKHIFDKFYQAEGSRSMEGNGLGLTLVKKILSLCDGTIEVTSQPDLGSKFTVKTSCKLHYLKFFNSSYGACIFFIYCRHQLSCFFHITGACF